MLTPTAIICAFMVISVCALTDRTPPLREKKRDNQYLDNLLGNKDAVMNFLDQQDPPKKNDEHEQKDNKKQQYQSYMKQQDPPEEQSGYIDQFNQKWDQLVKKYGYQQLSYIKQSEDELPSYLKRKYSRSQPHSSHEIASGFRHIYNPCKENLFYHYWTHNNDQNPCFRKVRYNLKPHFIPLLKDEKLQSLLSSNRNQRDEIQQSPQQNPLI
ncbi:uncharacterized protein LOC130891131 [Diorhabda carinulata]|uniref:uncharacterized protein LOC130891131 n=1 Tax=Diorhabda carinulata TaxID=1163345 RepID=UPI0025A05984|nr:uncharacterized protein LOC130891131 [Diorhabda carinulata]